MLLKHIENRHGAKITRLHGENDFVEHTFRLGQETERGWEIHATTKERLQQKGKLYTLFGYAVFANEADYEWFGLKVK